MTSTNEYPIGEDAQTAASDYNHDAPRPEDFVQWEKALDTSRRYRLFLVGGERKRRLPDDKWHPNRLEVKMQLRIAHDESLPAHLKCVQGKRVRADLFTDSSWYEKFCKGAQVDMFTFDPTNFPNLELMAKLKKRVAPKKTTDPETGVVSEEEVTYIDLDPDSVLRA